MLQPRHIGQVRELVRRREGLEEGREVLPVEHQVQGDDGGWART